MPNTTTEMNCYTNQPEQDDTDVPSEYMIYKTASNHFMKFINAYNFWLDSKRDPGRQERLLKQLAHEQAISGWQQFKKSSGPKWRELVQDEIIRLVRCGKDNFDALRQREKMRVDFLLDHHRDDDDNDDDKNVGAVNVAKNTDNSPGLKRKYRAILPAVAVEALLSMNGSSVAQHSQLQSQKQQRPISGTKEFKYNNNRGESLLDLVDKQKKLKSAAQPTTNKLIRYIPHNKLSNNFIISKSNRSVAGSMDSNSPTSTAVAYFNSMALESPIYLASPTAASTPINLSKHNFIQSSSIPHSSQFMMAAADRSSIILPRRHPPHMLPLPPPPQPPLDSNSRQMDVGTESIKPKPSNPLDAATTSATA